MTAVRFFNHLVQKGALQKNGRNTYACPIPSFRSFLIENGDKEP